MAEIPAPAPQTAVNGSPLYYLEVDIDLCKAASGCTACHNIDRHMPNRIVVAAWVVERSTKFKKLLSCCPHNAIHFGAVQ